MRKLMFVLSALMIASMLLTACGGGQPAATQPPAATQAPATEAPATEAAATERRNPAILNASRRRRIARGSGTDVQDVNRLMKQFREAQKMFKTLQKTGGRGMPRMFG